MGKIVDLFMETGDIEGLTELYNITGDEIIKIALNWRKDKEEWNSDYAHSMYNDMISYIFEKYKLNQ